MAERSHSYTVAAPFSTDKGGQPYPMAGKAMHDKNWFTWTRGHLRQLFTLTMAGKGGKVSKVMDLTVAASDRLLLVASDKELGGTLAQWLQDQKCRVIWAASAREAVQMLHDVCYIETGLDALLIDFDLADASGLRVIREFRSEFPWAPVALLTSEEDITTSLWAKAQNVKIVHKPLLLWELGVWLKYLKVPA